MYISVALVSAAGGITLFRHHIPFAIRAAFVVFLYFAGGIVGHLLYGSPYALTFFVASGIMAAVFFGEKIGL